jgi:crossover junction endonuclease MUS81
MLIIDVRENKLIDLIKTKSQFPIYQTASLPIGDIIIRHSERHSERHSSGDITYEIILERKCVTDMIASIKDGRYKEQKIRLLSEMVSSSNKVKIAYLIEGSIDELRAPPDKTILIGSVISSTFRDNIPILRTSSLQDTLDFIQRLHERLAKDYKDFFSNQRENLIPNETISSNNEVQDIEMNTNTETNTNISTNTNLYLHSIKKNKKDNMTPAMWNMNCLCGIPGVSSAIAIKIAEKYPTLRALLDAYQACTYIASRESLLADIILTETDKQRRRIGNVISKRIYEYFHQ